MALATLASAISQDIIILMTLPFWSLKFLCHFSAPDFQSHYNNDIWRNGTSHPGQCHFWGLHRLQWCPNRGLSETEEILSDVNWLCPISGFSFHSWEMALPTTASAISLYWVIFSCLFLNSNWWWITFGSTSCSNSWEMALVGVASASSWALAQDQEVLALSSEVIWQWWLSALLAQNFSGHPNFGTCHGVEGKPWGKSCSPEAHQLVHWDVQWIWQPRNGWCSGLQLRPQYRNMLFEWSNCIFTWVTVSVDSLKVPTWWTSSGRTMELFAVPFMTRWFALRGCSLLFSLSDVQQLWLCRCHQQKGVQRRLSYNLGCWALDQISASKEPRRVCMCSGSCKSSLKSHTTQSKIPLVSASRIWTLGPTSTHSQWPSRMGTPRALPWSSSWLLPSMCLWQTLSWNLFTLSLQHATASGVFIRLQVMLRLTSSIALQRSSVNHQGQDQTQFSVRSCFARWDG